MIDPANPRAAIDARIDKLNLYDDEVDAAVSSLPGLPLSYLPSNSGLVALNLALHNRGTIQIANEMVLALEILWKTQLVSAMALPARLLLELWAAATFARRLADQLGKEGTHSETFDRSVELLLGTRHEAPNWWNGAPSPIEGVRVKRMLKSLGDIRPETADEYAFLSEACHPNHLQHTYLWMAGRRGDNWSNAKFAAYAEGWLTRLLDIVEGAMEGLIEQSRALHSVCGSYIAADQPKPPKGN